MMTSQKLQELIQEQLGYYSAQAEDRDRIIQEALNSDEGLKQEWEKTVQSLSGIGPCQQVLELAGGTGTWTKELAKMAAGLTVLDGSPEMLKINQAKINDPRVRYERVNLFDWAPQREYDLVFFAFWLSHVPPDLLPPFLDKLPRAVAPGGRVFIIDEPAGGQEVSSPTQGSMYQKRTLQDGRIFNIIKVYYDPLSIQEQLRQRGFAPVDMKVGEYFFHLSSMRVNV